MDQEKIATLLSILSLKKPEVAQHAAEIEQIMGAASEDRFGCV